MSDPELQSFENNSDDLVGKIVQANTLESNGEIEQAIAIYQEISALDPGGNYGNVAQQAIENLQTKSSDEKVEVAEQKTQTTNTGSWWSRLSVKGKTSLILIGVALTASIGISTTAYLLVDKTVAQEVNRAKKAESSAITKEIALFMRDRRNDMQAISNIGIFANPELRASSTIEQKREVLNQYIQAYGIYNSIAIYDIEGELMVNSEGKPASNHKNHIYFQEAIKTGQPFVGQPRFSKSSGIFAVYTSAPIKDTKTGQFIGVIRARMPVENLQDIIFSESEFKRVYLLDKKGEIFLTSNENHQQQLLSSENEKIGLSDFFDFALELQNELDRRLNDSKLSATGRQNEAEEAQFVFSGQSKSAYLSTFNELEATNFLGSLPDLGWSTVVVADNESIFATQKQLLQVFIIGTILTGVVVTALSQLIANRATIPILKAAEAVDKIGQGNFDTRIAVQGEDELADLGTNINKMAGQIQDLLYLKEAEAKRQQQEKETLQQGVMNFLLDVEDARQGNLTVRAKMSDGPVGSIADAFNTTLNKLQELLQEVQTVSTDVGQLSLAGEDSVLELSQSALDQAEEINEALNNIEEINQSVETVAKYAQEAAQIAQHGSIQAKEGDLAMDATVNSIEKIRTTVASTAKKVKQLAESSQEIAQIVEIISGISEKTNLLAFNASVEAARAGEHGEGFRIVAEEVRRLADRITDATKDIQQLVTAIQQDTTSVLQGMETSTAEVVNGSELVSMTKLNLKSLAETSNQIDEYLKSISTNTIRQTNTSKQVNQKINGIATMAKTNSTQAQNVVLSLHTLVEEAETLQSSVSQFKLEQEAN